MPISLGLCASSAYFLPGGIIDPDWNLLTQTLANDSVFCIAIQSDNKALLGGNFTTWNGSSVGRIVRLNTDGTRDTSFSTNVGSGANDQIYTLATQSDGKILVGGDFLSWNGVSVGRIVRLNPDGTRDTQFTTNNGTGYGAQLGTFPIRSIIALSDGKILVGSQAQNWNGALVGPLVRLNPDGTRDTSFPTTSSGSPIVYCLAVQPDNKILVGGIFSSWIGISANYIVRLNSDGTVDTQFTINNGTGSNSDILAIALQSDGKIILGGWLTLWNNATVGRVVRLNSDGTRDTSFTTNIGSGANFPIFGIIVQKSDKIIIGGAYDTWNGASHKYLIRLNSNGTTDTAFLTNLGGLPNNLIYGLVERIDKKIFIGGLFTQIGPTSTARGRVVLIGGDE